MLGVHGKYSDGSYSSTLFFTIGFVPVFALGRYRVAPFREEQKGLFGTTVNNGYRFFERLPLDPNERWLNLFVLSVLAVALSFCMAPNLGELFPALNPPPAAIASPTPTPAEVSAPAPRKENKPTARRH